MDTTTGPQEGAPGFAVARTPAVSADPSPVPLRAHTRSG